MSWSDIGQRIGLGEKLTIWFGVAALLATVFVPGLPEWVAAYADVGRVVSRLIVGSMVLLICGAIVWLLASRGPRRGDGDDVGEKPEGSCEPARVWKALRTTAANFYEAVKKLHLELETEREGTKVNQARAFKSATTKAEYDYLQCTNRHLRARCIWAEIPSKVRDERQDMQDELDRIASRLRPSLLANPAGRLALAARLARFLHEKAKKHVGRCVPKTGAVS